MGDAKFQVAMAEVRQAQERAAMCRTRIESGQYKKADFKIQSPDGSVSVPSDNYLLQLQSEEWDRHIRHAEDLLNVAKSYL